MVNTVKERVYFPGNIIPKIWIVFISYRSPRKSYRNLKSCKSPRCYDFFNAAVVIQEMIVHHLPHKTLSWPALASNCSLPVPKPKWPYRKFLKISIPYYWLKVYPPVANSVDQRYLMSSTYNPLVRTSCQTLKPNTLDLTLIDPKLQIYPSQM
jgi:hypothetical protein